MEDQLFKALGPWPILQIMFGVAVLGFGAWLMVKGGGKKDGGDKPQIEDKRAEWKAYQELENIEANTFAMLELLKKIATNTGATARQLEHLNESFRQLIAALWNNQGPPRQPPLA